MEIRHGRVASGIRAIAILVVSITITAVITAAMLIDTLTAPALSSSAPRDCPRAVQPVVSTLELVDRRCW